jgi:hemerythrin
MQAFVWDAAFDTHLDAVDEQHHGLVALFNELNQSLFRGAATTADELEDSLQRLLAYAGQHFADEEALMRDVGLDERHQQAHRQLHAQFVEQVRTMWSLRATLSQPDETLMGFLTSWLGLHILGIDQSMARQIRAVRRGKTPQQAFVDEVQHPDQGIQALLKMVGHLYHVMSCQNADLVHANLTLEARVAERTLALEHANEQLRAFARTDGLLGINNRGYFDERLLEEVFRARRSKQPLGLLMMDVDYFKRYNDRYGHQAGDACLQAVAQAVGATLLRRTDFLARYGGEELIALLPNTDREGTQHTAQRILEAVRALALPHEHSDAAPVVTLSVGGVSVVPGASDEKSVGATLIALADAALYVAKQQGRNRLVMGGS